MFFNLNHYDKWNKKNYKLKTSLEILEIENELNKLGCIKKWGKYINYELFKSIKNTEFSYWTIIKNKLHYI